MNWNDETFKNIVREETPTQVNTTSLNAGGANQDSLRATAGLFEAGVKYRTTRPNGRSDWLLLLTIAGQGVLRNGSITFDLNPHSVCLIPENVPQDYGTSPGAKTWIFAFAHVKPPQAWAGIVATWPQAWGGDKKTTFNAPFVLRVGDLQLWRHAWSAMAEARHLLGRSLGGEMALVINLIESTLLWCDQANPTRRPQPEPRIRAAMEFIRQNTDHPINIKQIAGAAHLSPSRLNVLFGQQVNESPARYAERLRLEHAATLIALAGLNVQEAADAVGYDDPYHFSRRFKLRMGKPPSKWNQ